MSDVRYLGQGFIYETLTGSVENALNIRFQKDKREKTREKEVWKCLKGNIYDISTILYICILITN